MIDKFNLVAIYPDDCGNNAGVVMSLASSRPRHEVKSVIAATVMEYLRTEAKDAHGTYDDLPYDYDWGDVAELIDTNPRLALMLAARDVTISAIESPAYIVEHDEVLISQFDEGPVA